MYIVVDFNNLGVTNKRFRTKEKLKSTVHHVPRKGDSKLMMISL